MTAPRRIQRRRSAGWTLAAATANPNGAMIVDRTSRFGNPFKVADAIEWMGAESVEKAREICTAAFRAWLRGSDLYWMGPTADAARERLLAVLPELYGKDLACWCPLPEPGQPDHCHGAVLLRLVAEAPTAAEEQP